MIPLTKEQIELMEQIDDPNTSEEEREKLLERFREITENTIECGNIVY